MSKAMQKLDAIADEVFSMMDAPDIFAHLAGEVKAEALELRLREVLQSRQAFDTNELAVYLRASFVVKDRLPTWQPLLNAAIEQGRMRGERADDLFVGMMPQPAHPQRNTGQLHQQRKV